MSSATVRSPAFDLDEIVLANGRIGKADEAIDPAALARLVAALDGAVARTRCQPA